MSFNPKAEFKDKLELYMSSFYSINKVINNKNIAALLSAYSVYYNKDWNVDSNEKISSNIYDIASFILAEDKINVLVLKGLASIKNDGENFQILLTNSGIKKSIEEGNDIRNFQ